MIRGDAGSSACRGRHGSGAESWGYPPGSLLLGRGQFFTSQCSHLLKVETIKPASLGGLNMETNDCSVPLK